MTKTLITYRILAFFTIFMLSTSMINDSEKQMASYYPAELLYDGVWGTIYHAEARQCDKTPTITGDGSHIIPRKASTHRWIAISQDMLNDAYRLSLMKYPARTRLFKGKIQYGDTVWIESPHKEINGWWVTRDAKNAEYTNSIDFLQTKGDGTLYSNNPQWSGRFENIKIYRLSNISYKEYENMLSN